MSSEEYVFDLPEEARKFAEENLGENDATRAKALSEVRAWLGDNPGLNARTDDRFLLNFLRGCKFDVEKTRAKLTNYYTIKAERPEWFSERNPRSPLIQELVKLGVFVPLKRPIDNRMAVIIRTSAHDPKRHGIDDVLKAGKMVLDVAAMECEIASIYGVTAIFDMKNVTVWHARQLSPARIKNMVHTWQNYHCRPKQLEFVNAPLYVNVVLNVFKSFMREKLRKRVRVHFAGLDSLHRVVDRENLPPEYGGGGEDMQHLVGHWLEKLIAYEEWFREDEKHKAVLA